MFNTLIYLFVLKQCHGFLLANRSSVDVTKQPYKSVVNKVWGDAIDKHVVVPVEDQWRYEENVNKTLGYYPEAYDWTEYNAVSPVKDQQSCSACWAFAVVANIESQLKIWRNLEIILSEQFLIDCDFDQRGCSSGSIVGSFGNIITKFGGVLQYTDYFPYASAQQECRWQKGRPPHPIKVTGLLRIQPDEDFMVRVLYDYGPLSTGLSSSCITDFKPGTVLIPPENIKYENLNHAALIVGFGYALQDGQSVPFWKIKNSWGTDWGDQGFFKIVRGRNACGLAQDVSIAIIE